MRIQKFSEFTRTGGKAPIFEATQSSSEIDIVTVYKSGTKEIDRIIAKLSGHKSSKITRLVDRFVETKLAMEEAIKSHEEIKALTKDSINEHFEEEEKFITRVVETAKWSVTFNKGTKAKEVDTKKIKYEEALEEIYNTFPEIKDAINEIIKKNTEIKKEFKKEISGAINIDHIKLVNEGFKESMLALYSKIQMLYKQLSTRLKSTNKMLAKNLMKYRAMA